MSIAAWVRASRLPSQSYIFLPLLLGQALHVRLGGELSWSVFVLVHLFGLCDQLHIVYANDVADRETDALNTTTTVFSGGSRVLVNGQLEPGHLRRAAALMALCCLGISGALWWLHGRWLCVPLAGVALLLLWLYSFGPARLSYRGGGELLQMLGVGGVLPIYGLHAQSGSLDFPWRLLAVLLPTHLAAALTTTLPDEPSDRRSAKRTAAVLLGPGVVKAAVVALNMGAIAALHRLWPRHQPWPVALPLLANLAQLALWRSRPGTFGLSVLVFLGLLATLSLVAGMVVISWT